MGQYMIPIYSVNNSDTKEKKKQRIACTFFRKNINKYEIVHATR